MTITISEDCLIFYGFSFKTTKLVEANKAISDFVKKKRKIDPSGRFNFILFLQDGPSYLNHFTLDTEYVLKTLKLASNNVIKADIAGGIIIGISLLIENFKKTSKKLFRLLLLLDEGPYEIPPEQIPVIENLVKDVKNLPFYIDIISIENKNKEESEMLKNIAISCNGEFYQIKNVQDLNSLLNKLAEKKLEEEYLYSRYKLKMNQKEIQAFYVSLADKPSTFHELANCSICFQEANEDIVQCPSCGTVVHKTCWAEWAINSNIKVPYVFRCHNCFYLLKLDKNFVFDVQFGKIPTITKLNKIKEKDINDYLQDLESKIKPKIVKAEDPAVTEFREIINSKKSNSESKENEIIVKVNICPICNNIVTGDKKYCQICGFFLS